MKTEQRVFSLTSGWQPSKGNVHPDNVQLVFLFGDRDLLKQPNLVEEVQSFYPKANVVGCSTAGEICGSDVLVNTVVCTAIEFKDVRVSVCAEEIDADFDSMHFGKKLASKIDKTNLKHVFVLSEALDVNGSQLTKGLNEELGNNITVTGGLAGDYAMFKETVVVCNAAGRNGIAVIVGLYGDNLRVGYGSKGGWKSFGVDRLVTKSTDNILYELDGKPALSIYKSYLGKHAEQLPSAAFLFPISFKSGDDSIVRTILSINESDESMVFAGDIPQGEYVRLMNASNDKLFEGAMNAAEESIESLNDAPAQLALLISCVGRKILLKNRTDEEVEAVKDVLGNQATLMGFYSYGEICPPNSTEHTCELHNQTMTITVLTEL